MKTNCLNPKLSSLNNRTANRQVLVDDLPFIYMVKNCITHGGLQVSLPLCLCLENKVCVVFIYVFIKFPENQSDLLCHIQDKIYNL